MTSIELSEIFDEDIDNVKESKSPPINFTFPEQKEIDFEIREIIDKNFFDLITNE